MIAVVVGIIIVLITTAVLWFLAHKNRKKREAAQLQPQTVAHSQLKARGRPTNRSSAHWSRRRHCTRHRSGNASNTDASEARE